MKKHLKSLIVMLVMIVMCSTAAYTAYGSEDMQQPGGGTERIEGSGWDTKEEAARAYIEGLMEQDVSKMLSACAVETFVEHFDLVRQTERNGAFMPVYNDSYLPLNGEFSYQLNLERRRSQMTDLILYQYLAMTKSEASEVMSPVMLEPGQSAADLLSQIYGPEDLEITLEGEILPTCLVSPEMLSVAVQRVAAMNAYVDHADQLDSVAALLRVNGESYLLTLGTECFDGKWYITNYNHFLLVMGMDSRTGGLVPISATVDLRGETLQDALDAALTDEKLNAILTKFEEAKASLDIEQIFSGPRDEWMAAFETAYSAAVSEYLSEEDMEYMEMIMENR